MGGVFEVDEIGTAYPAAYYTHDGVSWFFDFRKLLLLDFQPRRYLFAHLPSGGGRAQSSRMSRLDFRAMEIQARIASLVGSLLLQ